MEVQPCTSLLGLTTDLVARVAVPKPARRVRLVRRLVLGEPDVAIDAEHRALGVARNLRREPRSEEHTSELQSPCNLVCRLLLEKKKKQESSILKHLF